jgi:Fic-DOC domain mobile mystery protein B
MALTGQHAPGATPLRPEDLEGLKLPNINTFGALNEVEAANIILGQEWALRARGTLESMLTDRYVQRLHQRMYGDVWDWAGRYRTHNTNIGSDYPSIRVDLRVLFDDAVDWLANHRFEPDEFAVRIHHRIVKVHPFANGNGRHARMVADMMLLRHFKLARLSWGGGTLSNVDPNRERYIAALREADHNSYAPLLQLARVGTA